MFKKILTSVLLLVVFVASSSVAQEAIAEDASSLLAKEANKDSLRGQGLERELQLFTSNCATIKSSTIYIYGSPSNSMDSKVWGCPYGYSWESCCAACGVNFQTAGTLSAGWYCQKDFWSTGIWLKGCNKNNACF